MVREIAWGDRDGTGTETHERVNAVVLVPSNRAAVSWEEDADLFCHVKDLPEIVERLKSGEHLGVVVLINKYASRKPMEIQPRPGTTGRRLWELLIHARSDLNDIQRSPGTWTEQFHAYQDWTNNQVRMLALAVSGDVLDALVTTPRHWFLLGLDPTSKGSASLSVLRTEIDQQAQTLDAALERLTERRSEYANVDRLVVPDTNAFLHTNAIFIDLDWSQIMTTTARHPRVVVSMLVVDELDAAKRSQKKVHHGGTEQVGSRARRTVRELQQLFQPDGRPAKVRGVQFGLHAESPGHVRLSDPDSELIDQALGLGDLTGQQVSILSGDVGMKLRAMKRGLHVIEVPESWSFPD